MHCSWYFTHSASIFRIIHLSASGGVRKRLESIKSRPEVSRGILNRPFTSHVNILLNNFFACHLKPFIINLKDRVQLLDIYCSLSFNQFNYFVKYVTRKRWQRQQVKTVILILKYALRPSVRQIMMSDIRTLSIICNIWDERAIELRYLMRLICSVWFTTSQWLQLSATRRKPGPKFTDIVLRFILRCVIRSS